MRGTIAGLLVFLVVADAPIASAQGADGMVCTRPGKVDDVLVNPGMGLFQAYWGKERTWEPSWVDEVVSLIYFRDVWARLEGEEGDYKFATHWDPMFEYWASKGKRICFGVMSSSMHSKLKYTTPEYVFKAGVPGVMHQGLYIDEQIEPVFWNPIYLEKLCKFIAALGEHYNGKPYLEFLDMRGIGEWGEMHMARWTPADKREQGYTFYKYMRAYRTMIDAYLKAFPDTHIALNMNDYPTIVDYAVSKKIFLRLDGLTMNGPEIGRRYFHKYYKDVPVLYEFCWGKKTIEERGQNVPDTIANGLKDPISYMNLNFMSRSALAKLPPGDPIREMVMTAARKVGYRFVIEEVHHRPILFTGSDRGTRVWVKTVWRNIGVAPCYASLALGYFLCDESGKVLHEEPTFPRTPTNRWYPDETVSEEVVFTLPKDMMPGKYTLKLALFDPLKPEKKTKLGIEGRDEQDRYTVASIEIRRRTAPAERQVPVVFDFQDGKERFHAHKGIEVDVVSEAEAKSLAVRGTETGGYNYAHTDKFPLLPFSEYKLSCRMKVNSVKADKRGPYLKCGLYGRDAAFLGNRNTGTYDLTKLGTWQTLEGYFETNSQTTLGLVAIEKGTTAAAEVDMLLDDITIELLASP